MVCANASIASAAAVSIDDAIGIGGCEPSQSGTFVAMSRTVLANVRTCTSTICRVSFACCRRSSAFAHDDRPGCRCSDWAALSTSASAAVANRPCSRAVRSQSAAMLDVQGLVMPPAMVPSTSTSPSPNEDTDRVASPT